MSMEDGKGETFQKLIPGQESSGRSPVLSQT